LNDSCADDGAHIKRDEIGLNRHRALAFCLSMIVSENRFTLFRIMLWKRKRAPGLILGARLAFANYQ
jgi:hypothetical protein